MSEESFRPHVEIFLFPREHSKISTWISALSSNLCPLPYKRICATSERPCKSLLVSSGYPIYEVENFRKDCPDSDIIVIFARESCEPLLALEGLGASHTYV